MLPLPSTPQLEGSTSASYGQGVYGRGGGRDFADGEEGLVPGDVLDVFDVGICEEGVGVTS